MSIDELVDVVDEAGNFIKVVSKKEAHENGLLHKCVVGEVIDSKGHWHLSQASEGKQDAKQYISPMGGHISAGEDEKDALIREAKEEMGFIENLNYEYVGQAILDRKILGRHENHILVVYKIFSDTEIVLNEEHQNTRSFTEDELKKGLKENPEKFGEAFHFVVNNFFRNFL